MAFVAMCGNQVAAGLFLAAIVECDASLIRATKVLAFWREHRGRWVVREEAKLADA